MRGERFGSWAEDALALQPPPGEWMATDIWAAGLMNRADTAVAT